MPSHHPALGTTVLLPLLLPGVAAAQQFQFMTVTPRAPERLWSSTSGVSAGFALLDVNGDGRRDVAFVEGGRLHAALRQADSTYIRQQIFDAAPAVPPSVHDFDRDGLADLWFAARRPGLYQPLRLLRRVSNGWQSIDPFGAFPSLLVHGADCGDVDGDGDLDIVLAPHPAQDLPALVLLRNVSTNGPAFTAELGAFQPSLPNGIWPQFVDFDRDGDLDVLGSIAAGGFALLRNDGTTFVNVTSSLPMTRPGTAFHCVADFDGDGRVDAAVALANGDLDMLWGTATGFAVQTAVVPAVRAQRLVPVDIDGDGDLDLAAERIDVGIDLLRNIGNRQFHRATAVAMATHAFAVGDLEGDGVADFVFAIRPTTTATAMLVHAAPRGEWAPDAALRANRPALPTMTAHACVGDFDGDGTDVVVNSYPGLTVHCGNGDDTWRPLALQIASEWRHTPTPIDIEGDGDVDVVATAGTDLVLHRNGGAADFTAIPLPQLPELASGPASFGDIDADGDQDMILPLSRSIGVMRNLGNATFAPVQVAMGGTVQNPCAVLVDLDGDGDLDLATGVNANDARDPDAEWDSTDFLVLGNDGVGNFTQRLSTFRAVAPRQVAARDIDHDGDMDLITWTTRVRLFANDGTGQLANVSAAAGLTTNFTATVLADFDDDGNDDLLDLITRRLLRSDGTGRFLASAEIRLGAFDTNLHAADVDDDGDLDLIGLPIAINHLRQLQCRVAPHLGRPAHIDIWSGPGFSSPGVAALLIAPALAATAQSVPGIAGKLQLDASTLQLAAIVPTTLIGLSSAFVPVPNDLRLLGLEVFAQAIVLPQTGRTGFTNAVREVVLR